MAESNADQGKRPRHWNYAQAGEKFEQQKREARERAALAYVEDLCAEAKRQAASDEEQARG
jgi:hypothetical protein